MVIVNLFPPMVLVIQMASIHSHKPLLKPSFIQMTSFRRCQFHAIFHFRGYGWRFSHEPKDVTMSLDIVYQSNWLCPLISWLFSILKLGFQTMSCYLVRCFNTWNKQSNFQLLTRTSVASIGFKDPKTFKVLTTLCGMPPTYFCSKTMST